MKRIFKILTIMTVLTVVSACSNGGRPGNRITRIWLMGDSTVADYSLEDEYMTRRFPITGWGQVFQPFFTRDSLQMLRNLVHTDSVLVDDRAKGGRSSRSFFEEGRWSEIYRELQPGDIVLIQFGHNDASVSKGERYVSVPGYKEFLRLYVNMSRDKGAIPILITPVARNYPWENGKLGNTHGDYPDAMKSVAEELDVPLIDLNRLSMEYFSKEGQDYVTVNYFMNLPAGRYEAYPDGQNDNTHFQPEGAKVVASLVFQAMKKIETDKAGRKKQGN